VGTLQVGGELSSALSHVWVPWGSGNAVAVALSVACSSSSSSSSTTLAQSPCAFEHDRATPITQQLRPSLLTVLVT
jgi:hypothetical protein